MSNSFLQIFLLLQTTTPSANNELIQQAIDLTTAGEGIIRSTGDIPASVQFASFVTLLLIFFIMTMVWVVARYRADIKVRASELERQRLVLDNQRLTNDIARAESEKNERLMQRYDELSDKLDRAEDERREAEKKYHKAELSVEEQKRSLEDVIKKLERMEGEVGVMSEQMKTLADDRDEWKERALKATEEKQIAERQLMKVTVERDKLQSRLNKIEDDNKD